MREGSVLLEEMNAHGSTEGALAFIHPGTSVAGL
jgi:hypothetical protein